MLRAQKIEKLASGNSLTRIKSDTSVFQKRFLMFRGSRTLKTTTSSKRNGPVKPDASVKSDGFRLSNTLQWANLIFPMPVIASTMYRHYAKGNTKNIT